MKPNLRKKSAESERPSGGGNGSARAQRAQRAVAQGAPAPEEFFEKGMHVEEAVTINRPRQELYRFWRDFPNLARFMKNIQSVTLLDGNQSHWISQRPGGRTVEWDAQIINDEPDALIAWRSVGASDIDHAGSVRFLDAPGGRGTEVKVAMDYVPPAGKLGAAVAKLLGGEPSEQVREDLCRFKQLMETGEIATIQGQPRGECKG